MDPLCARQHQVGRRASTSSPPPRFTNYLSLINIDVPAVGAGHARNAAWALAELGQAFAALKALHDVAFLAEAKGTEAKADD